MTDIDLNRLQNFMSDWLEALMDTLDTEIDEETRKTILESCGRACARNHATELFQTIKNSSKDLNEVLDKLNQQLKGTTWQRINDNTIAVEYERCFCPLVGAKLVTSSTRCYCSVGWIKENLELVLEKSVNVESEKAVGRGDPICRFQATF
ncbi:MAG: cellulose biosynthesis protein BcsD [Candidatus Hodarchaeota archaeon]